MITLTVKKQGTENDWEQLDVSAPETLSLSYDIGDPAEPMIRKSPVSQTFRLPLTNKNNKFFNHYYDPDSVATTYSASFKCKARLQAYGQEIFTGALQLVRVHLKAEEYEVLLYGEEATLFEAVKGKKLVDAFLNSDGTYDDSLDHDLTSNTVANSWFSDITNGNVGNGTIVYPVVDAGYTDPYGYLHMSDDSAQNQGMMTPNYLKAAYLKPAINLDYLFRRILSSNGFYLKDSTFLESSAWTDIYMYIGGEPKPLVTDILDACRVGFAQDSGQGGFSTDPDTFGNQYGLDPVPFRIDSGTINGLNMFDLGDDFDTTTHTYTCPFAGSYRGRLNLVFKGNSASSAYIPMNIRVQHTTNNYVEYNVNLFVGSSGNGYSIKYFEWELHDIPALGEITVLVWSTVDTWTLERLQPPHQDRISYFEVNGIASDQGTVNMPANLPGMTQETFLRDLVQRFNLVIEADKDNPSFLTIDNWTDYLANSTAYEWTDKLDLSRPRQLKPTNEYKAKRIELQDATDDTLVLQSYADSNLGKTYGHYAQNVVGDFNSGEIVNDAVFAPWVPYPIPKLGDSNAFEIPGFVVPREYGRESGDTNTNQVRALPKLFYYNGYVNTDSGVSWYIDETELTLYPSCTALHQPQSGGGNDPATVDENTEYLGWAFNAPPYYYSAGHYGGAFTNQGYWVRYWSQYLNNFYARDARVLECYLNLTPQDIQTFRFNDTIKIQGQNYRVLSIDGYKPGSDEVTKVKLLKLVFTPSNLFIPPDPDEEVDEDGEVIGECDEVAPYFFNDFGAVFFENTTNGNPIPTPATCCVEYGFTMISGYCIYDVNLWEEAIGSNDEDEGGGGGDGYITDTHGGTGGTANGGVKRGVVIGAGYLPMNDMMNVSGSVSRFFKLKDSPLRGSSRNFTLMESIAAGETRNMSSDGRQFQAFYLPSDCSVFIDIKLNVHVETDNTSATVNVGDTQFIHEQYLYKEVDGTITEVGTNEVTNIGDTNVDCELIVGVFTVKGSKTSATDPGLKIAVRNNMSIVQVGAVAEVTLVVSDNAYQPNYRGLITERGEFILTETGEVIFE